ncbi:MAG: hypothetical protein JWR36_2815, partial [Glaciihabitans sp.]|nr:hypothetical protein [Glaciihabitans sp.]
DYSPLLSLQDAELVIIHPVRGMSPSAVDLEWSVPGMGEAAAQRYSASQRIWTHAELKPDPQPSTAEELEVIQSIDEVWSGLLDGRTTRLRAVVWARNPRRYTRGLTREGIRELENLTGYPWEHPPDSLHLKLFRWLDDWRASVRQFAIDPQGEPRREALRTVSRLVISHPGYVRSIFRDYVSRGLLGPDDEAVLALPPDE